MFTELDTLCAADVPASKSVTEWVSNDALIHICKRGERLVATLTGIQKTSYIGVLFESKSNITMDALKASPKITLSATTDDREVILVQLLSIDNQVTASQEFPLRKMEQQDALREHLIALRHDPLPDFEMPQKPRARRPEATLDTLARILAEMKMHTH